MTLSETSPQGFGLPTHAFGLSTQGFGLSTLAQVPLSAEREAFLEGLRSGARDAGPGSPAWRVRKLAEVRDLFALETIAARMHVLALDAATELLALVHLTVPVPRLVDGELVIESGVRLVLRYPEQILRQPLPGYALVQVQEPRNVWHSNVSSDPAQRLCLGANVPKGLPLREAVLGSYAALTLQSITLDGADPAGVMNPGALRYWNEHLERIPLSREAFLDVPGPQMPADVDSGEVSS